MKQLPVNQPDLTIPQALAVLRKGEMQRVHGLLPWGSNHTFLVTVTSEETQVLAVYKPRLGERPLWDFADGSLCVRERAAFIISEMLGWHFVPATVLRDGEHGYGSVQYYVSHDASQNYFDFGPAFEPQLRRIALFDHVINNADRKGGHCLLAEDGKLWAIDHGVCFHSQPKIRTVIWDFAGESIPHALVSELRTLCEHLDTEAPYPKELRQLLTQRELLALQHRIDSLTQSGVYPQPGPGRSYPWPPV